MDNTINISDEFDQRQGRWFNYDVHIPAARANLREQSHVDIRSFADDENWTEGTVTYQTDRKRWWGITLSCDPGENVTESVIPSEFLGVDIPVDILTGFEDDDFLSVTLPAFPLDDIDTNNSYIEFSSNLTDWTQIALSDSTIPLTNGDSEWRVERAQLTDVDLQFIRGVRFRINAINACDFRALAIRLLGKDWGYTQYDIDTRLEHLKPTVAPNGKILRAFDFTTPALYRSGNPPGAGDPKPIDLSVGIAFNTGSKTGGSSITTYFREAPGDFAQMADLNDLAMSDLDGEPVPDITGISYGQRTMAELDFFTQDDLTGDTQFEIERTIDTDILSFIQMRVTWTASSTTAYIQDSEGNGYTFSDLPTLVVRTMYIIIAEVEDTSARLRIYPLDDEGTIDTTHTILDTGLVNDPFNFPRRAGRFGWSAVFSDGDAYIERIRTRSQVYASLLTLPYESLTPVEGAELKVVGSAPLDYFTELSNTGFANDNVIVERDNERQLSGSSWRITNPMTVTSSELGVMTNLADFNDFNQTEIDFDIYYPSSPDIELIAVLLSENLDRPIELELPTILRDRWHHVTLTVSNTLAQTGRYRLYLVQGGSDGIPITWWLDNIQIRERMLSFYGRSELEDPWHDAAIDWIPFKNTINKDSSAVQFIERGQHLQILAKAHHTASRIDSLHVVPKYSQLGRFVWDEDELFLPQSPVAAFTHTTPDLGDRHISFDATTSSDPDGEIINYEWNFGNGDSAYGVLADYEYPEFGTFTATLIVTDRQGLQDRTSQDITLEVA